MNYQTGDQVVHWVHGPGTVLRTEEKALSGHSTLYYVVQIQDLTVWVPTDESSAHSLRHLTPAQDFEKLFEILRSPAEPLSMDRLERKLQLAEKMKAGSLEAICQVVRDLSFCRRNKKLSDNDTSILERAQTFLLHEWVLALSVTPHQAEQELERLLVESFAKGSAN